MRTDIIINYSNTSCISIRHVTHNIITVPINMSYNNAWHQHVDLIILGAETVNCVLRQ